MYFIGIGKKGQSTWNISLNWLSNYNTMNNEKCYNILMSKKKIMKEVKWMAANLMEDKIMESIYESNKNWVSIEVVLNKSLTPI